MFNLDVHPWFQDSVYLSVCQNSCVLSLDYATVTSALYSTCVIKLIFFSDIDFVTVIILMSFYAFWKAWLILALIFINLNSI